jgi:Cd2+/Zn2+-exporting ATPase
VVAYIPVGFPVLKEAAEEISRKDFFNEFTLMALATIGAFAIKEYPEAVAVMLFYSVGELFQNHAVNKAQNNIKALLDVRPDIANVLRDGVFRPVHPEDVSVGETIQVKAGEKAPLDGTMISEASSFNTSALTGESKPSTIRRGEKVLAGMLNEGKVIEIRVEKLFSDSSLAKILDMVQNAASRKAKTELFIHKFAKIYTPAVFFLALLITFVPYFFVETYLFAEWLYRALVFLVISCPCALVISVPLGYFGGIGAASRNGILFKGANYLELMTTVNTVVMDKTGTLTKGVFNVQEVHPVSMDRQEFVNMAAAVESYSNHPVAKAVVKYAAGSKNDCEVSAVEEIPGHGLIAKVNGDDVAAGNAKIMKKLGVTYNSQIDGIVETTVLIAVNKTFAGHIVIADEVKEDARQSLVEMRRLGVRRTVMLSGDKDSIVQKIAKKIDLDRAYGNLLPEDKVRRIEELKKDANNVIAFVGDGINDTPALALSDVGIAMGGMGSDAAIEIADVVIQTDQPSKIAAAIRIAKATKRVVIQNISMALSVKALVLLLGALGIASMWMAVFADVGVALLAILNAMRILNKKF